MDFPELIEQIKHFASLAVNFDRLGNSEAAAYYYMETSFLIDSAPDPEELKIFRVKAVEYKNRAEELLSCVAKKAGELACNVKVRYPKNHRMASMISPIY